MGPVEWMKKKPSFKEKKIQISNSISDNDDDGVAGAAGGVATIAVDFLLKNIIKEWNI